MIEFEKGTNIFEHKRKELIVPAYIQTSSDYFHLEKNFRDVINNCNPAYTGKGGEILTSSLNGQVFRLTVANGTLTQLTYR